MPPLLLAACLAIPADKPAEAPPNKLSVEGTRQVLAAVVAAAGTNSRLDTPRKGEELTVYLVRAAAQAAERLPREQAGPAFLLALGVALDRSDLVRRNLLFGRLWRQVETDDERKQRLAVLGTPTIHAREDLCQHFAVSAALTAAAGAGVAETIGLAKELADAHGGTGFSFADLAANLGGIELGRAVLAAPATRLGRLAKDFRPADHVLRPAGLAEGLTADEFAKRYGALADPRFRKALDDLRRRTRELPGHR